MPLNLIVYGVITLIVFVSYLIWRKQNYPEKKWYDLESYNPFLITCLIAVVCITLANVFFSTISFKSTEAEYTYAMDRHRYDMAFDAAEKLVKEHPENLDNRFQDIKLLFRLLNTPAYRTNEAINKKDSIVDAYAALAKSADKNTQQIGYWGEAYLALKAQEDLHAFTDFANLINNQDMKYVNEMKGLAYIMQGENAKAVGALKREISIKGDQKGAYNMLADLYYEQKNYTGIYELYHTVPDYRWISQDELKEALLRQGDIIAYFTVLIPWILSTISIDAFLGAMLTALAWILYLILIGRYKKGRYLSVISSITAGVVLSYFAILIYDEVFIKWGFNTNGSFQNDLLYSISVIGGAEELVKIIPFLFILGFTKLLKEPIDYIIYACLSAIGFSLMENLMYFSNYPLSPIISTRALLCTTGHMVFSSIIAYSIVLWKFRKKGNLMLNLVAGYIVAASVHGIYDLFLFNSYFSYPLLSLFVWISCVIVLSVFINNAINNSGYYQDVTTFDPARIVSYLMSALLAVYVFDYVIHCWHDGAITTNTYFLPAVLFLILFLVFVANKLGNIDIMQGDWQPIRFAIRGKNRNYNKALGLEVTLTPLRHSSILQNYLPLNGTIAKRVRLADSNNCFMIQLNEPVTIDGMEHPYVLVRSKENRIVFEQGGDIVVYFMLATDPIYYTDDEKLEENFEFIDWAILN